MAQPVASLVKLPDDSGNSGKQIRTQTRVVSGNTVHEHFFQSVRQAQVTGVYRSLLAQVTILAAAQNGTSTGFLWMHNPAANTNKKFRVRRLWISSQHATALATPTAPRIVMARMTFTGTASGASVTACKVDTTAGAASAADLRTAVTGLTVSLVANFGEGAIVGAVTAVGAYAPISYEIIDAGSAEDEWPVFAPGEGFVLYQDTAGTTSDTRVANIRVLWDETDTA